MISVADIIAHITSEHQAATNYVSTVTATVQPFVTNAIVANGFTSAFDLDAAVGVQLDIVGQWVGKDRFVSLPNVYFSLDDANLGLDQGWLQGPFDPATHLSALDDTHYRILLYATIIANHWDGSIPFAYAAWQTLFLGSSTVLIQDNGNMTLYQALVSSYTIDAVTKSLFLNGALSLRPSGVELQYYIVEPIPSQRLFALDCDTTNLAGLDYGAFGTETYAGVE